MDASQLVRRVMMAAAVSAGTVSVSAQAEAMERGVSRAARPNATDSAEQQTSAVTNAASTAQSESDSTLRTSEVLPTQYQQPAATPPQNQPQSSSVQAELQRLFRENGQEMPSMRQQDLPYATTPQMQMVRPTQKKPSLFRKIVGRIKGESPPPEEPVAMPPQPPAYNPQANVVRKQTAAAPSAPARRLQPAPTQQTGPAAMEQPVRRRGVIVAPAARPAPGTTQAAPATQPQSITVSQPGNTSSPSAFRIVRPPQQSANGGFVQPGRAPAFLPQDTPQPEPAAAVTQPQQEAAPARAADVRPTPSASADTFLSPFAEPAAEPESSDLLDLDSLVEAPQPEVAPAQRAPAEPAQVPAATLQDELAAEDVAPEPQAAAAPSGNPFTGVELDMGAEELIGGSDESAGAKVAAPAAAPAAAELPSLKLSTTEDGGTALTPAPLGPEPVGKSDTKRIKQKTPTVTVSTSTEQLHQMSERQRRQRQRALILSRPGQSGFKGFCPVTLRDSRELVDADPQFTSAFGLQEYEFASARAKAAFESDPARYAPAAGGSDIVLLVNAGEEQAGSLDFAVWYRDRIYMFQSRETLSLFVADPQKFASQY
jgi:YHS domain-containing protein